MHNTHYRKTKFHSVAQNWVGDFYFICFIPFSSILFCIYYFYSHCAFWCKCWNTLLFADLSILVPLSSHHPALMINYLFYFICLALKCSESSSFCWGQGNYHSFSFVEFISGKEENLSKAHLTDFFKQYSPPFRFLYKWSFLSVTHLYTGKTAFFLKWDSVKGSPYQGCSYVHGLFISLKNVLYFM